MTLSRRKSLALIGGGTLFAATAGSATFLATRTPEKALAPWDLAGGYTDPRENALSFALLAPNPHNRQPWLARLDGADTVTLFRDPTRNLPHTDPYARQLTIGMGCFLELMVLAAGKAGYSVDLTLFPDGEAEDKPVAHAVFKTGGTPDPLFDHVMDRRSVKEPFDMTKAVEDQALDTLESVGAGPEAINGTLAPGRVGELRGLISDAFEIEANTPRTWAESIDLLRIGKRQINDQPDGIDLGDPMLEVLHSTGLMPRESLKDPASVGFRGTLDAYNETFAATPAFIWVTTPGNDRPAQIAAGRAWTRINLAATGLGLGLHPVSQALQEYPEMAEPYARVHQMLAGPGETVQMLGRLGYGPSLPRTPRWPLEAKLIDV